MIYSIGNNGKLYNINGNRIICNHCGKECKKYYDKSLVFELTAKEQITSICPPY